MTFLDDFEEDKTTPVTVYRETNTYNPTTGKSTVTTTTAYSGTEIFWRGSMAEQVVADKIRPQVDAVLILDTDSVNTNDIVSTTEGRYRVIYEDNIGYAGDVYQYSLELVK